MKNSLKIKRMVGIAILATLVIGLQLLSNYIQFGPVSITLALIPIAVGAILYGPIAGLILGLFMGLIVLTAPSTQAYFFVYNPAATIILCLLKTGLAGLVAGLIFKLFAKIALKKENNSSKKKLFVGGIMTSSIIIPIINTGLFLCGVLLFFIKAEPYNGSFKNVIAFTFTTNFLIEFLVSSILSPVVVSIVKIITAENDLGYATDFNVFSENKKIEETETTENIE